MSAVADAVAETVGSCGAEPSVDALLEELAASLEREPTSDEWREACWLLADGVEDVLQDNAVWRHETCGVGECADVQRALAEIRRWAMPVGAEERVAAE